MNNRSPRATWWLGALSALLIAAGIAAQGPPGPAPGPPATPAAAKTLEAPAEALAYLQAAHAQDGTVFVLQEELDPLIPKEGGGACATAAGIDALQAVRVMSGRKPVSNPHKAALAAFAAQPALLAGRVSNAQLVALLESYRLPPHQLALEMTVESAPNSGYREQTRTWAGSGGPDLTVRPRQLKLLSYTVTDADQAVIGRHFVLLKHLSGRRVNVVDPASPGKDRVYDLDYKPGEQGDKARVMLINPPEQPRKSGLVFELSTVFTAALAAGPPPAPVGPRTVDEINRRIDETANELRGTKDYLNPRAWRKKTAAFGLPGLDLPVELGGAGWPASKVIDVFRHAGRHNLNFRDIVGGAHVRPLLKSNNPAVRDIVRQIARGDGYVAIAITEPEAGTDIPAIRSAARKTDGGFLLTGTKRYNARLDQASHVVIFTQGTAGVSGKLSAFVVPIGTPGLKVESFPAHGLTGNSYGGLEFKDLFVPAGQLLGEDGEGLKIFFEHFLYWRLMQSAAAIGTGEDALEQMKDRIKVRHAFGGPIGRFTHLQQPIGQHTTELRMAHALAREIADRIDRGNYDKETRALICGLKAEGVEVALKAVDAATRAFGGEGYSTKVDLGDRLRDLNGLRIADGTTDVMRMEVVRQTYGEEFWEMAVQERK